MLHARRPELLARELIHLLDQTACAEWAAAVSGTDSDDRELLAACGDPLPTAPPDQAPKRIPVGVARERQVELLLAPKPDIDALTRLIQRTLAPP